MRARTSSLCVLFLCACGSSGGDAPLPEPTYVSTRVEADVCARWVSGHEEAPVDPWSVGISECAHGAVSDEARAETITRIDLFRYLVELPPVTEDLAQREDDQACAIMMHVNDALDHSPPMSWDCYSDAGKRGAATSNLAIGTGSPADAIDLFMRDDGVGSLGHRRWIVNFALGQVGIGFAGNATCLGVFDDSGASTRDFVAYPAPGPAPLATASGVWSFHAKYALEGAAVTVHDLATSTTLDVDVDVLDSGYGAEAIAITRRGWTPAVGSTYRVGVTVPSRDAVVYDVRVVDCGG